MNGTTKFLLRGTSLAMVALASLAAPGAFAQSAESEDQDIVVTGTRLRGVAPVGSPIQSITVQDLENNTETSTARVIQQIPQVFDLGVSEGSRGQSGGSGNIVYGTGINLRGLGPNATLLLVDGHRAVNNTRALDPSVIPSLGLQRIEVLADGASALYGSDAVAGVVNLVPIRFKDGGQAFFHGGMGDEYKEHEFGLSWGKTWEGGQIHLAYENARRSAVHGADREFFRQDQRAQGGLDYRINQCDPGTIVIGTTNYPIPAGGVTTANRSALVAGAQNLCEGSLHQDLLPEQDYNSFVMTFNQKLTPNIEFFADGFYSKREFYRAVADTAANLTVPSSNAFFVAPPGLTPASEIVRYSLRSDLPPADSWGFAKNYELTAGLGIDLPAEWRLEALATYGESRDNSESRTALNNAAMTTALASSNPATAFDPFGLHRTQQSVLDLLGNQIFLAPTNNEFVGYEARIDGPLFSLPGGQVKLAAGYERQDLDIHLGSARGNPTTPIVFRNFSRTVDSFYAELYVPIVGDGNAVPGIRRLEFNIAGRFDDYSDVGSTTNPKYGVNWSPVEGLTFRGSYGTSLRAPTFAEIYGNSNNLFTQNYTDPTLPGTRQGVALSGGNPNLKPEEATTWTAGFDFTPEQLSGLRFSATYFDIDYQGQTLANLSNLNILSVEQEYAGTGVILRGAAAAARVAEVLASGVAYAGAAAGNPITLFVDGRTYNLGRSAMQGVDFDVSYSWSGGEAGDFGVSLYTAFITSYESSLTPKGALVDRLDTIFNPHDFKARGTFSWDRDPFRAFMAVNYVGEYKNNLLAAVQTVDAFVTVDANLTWEVGESGVELGVDARNLLDEDPPYVNVAPNANGSGGYDATAANPTGRVVGLSFRKRW
ncbi:MAG: TonB-dependent receptor [Hyphomonadaceae bacterium]|nr:TonB-dependent receptor [Hyphomonadaceae bacterium]